MCVYLVFLGLIRYFIRAVLLKFYYVIRGGGVVFDFYFLGFKRNFNFMLLIFLFIEEIKIGYRMGEVIYFGI